MIIFIHKSLKFVIASLFIVMVGCLSTKQPKAIKRPRSTNNPEKLLGSAERSNKRKCVIAKILIGNRIRVNPIKSVIVVPIKKDNKKAFAAEELQKHFKLITGKIVPIIRSDKIHAEKYPFYVGIYFPDESRKLSKEDTCWKVTPKGTYLFGNDSQQSKGTLFAVYCFLEQELGVRWLEPGDDGIAYKTQKLLKLNIKSFFWRPILEKRSIRNGIRPRKKLNGKKKYLKFFQQTANEYKQFKKDVVTWQKRMYMGSRVNYNYGHAFSKWWKKYGKEHPEYFAINKYGKRAPEPKTKAQSDNPTASRNLKSEKNIKICPSNIKVADRIVENYLKSKIKSKYVNVCEDDSPPWGFCRCSDCRKLDVPVNGEKFGDYAMHLTDRYIFLVNNVSKQIKKYKKDAWVTTYAYNETERPPLREKIERDVIVGIVPTRFETKYLKDLFEGWKNAGAKKIFLRPNFHWYYMNSCMPLGIEEYTFNIIKTAYHNGLSATDYDSLVHFWPATGIVDYIQAKAMSDPKKSFKYWENHYCSGYGAAEKNVKKYFRYWRKEVWGKRVNPNISEIVKKGKYFNFIRGLMWNLGDYYKRQDFEHTDKILTSALNVQLTIQEKKRLNKLLLANRHARLIFNAVTLTGEKKMIAAKALLAFRKKYKDTLNFQWGSVFHEEARYGDIAGIDQMFKLKDFDLPYVKTDLFWYFKLDSKNQGLSSGWVNISPSKFWSERMPTNHFWETPHKHYPFPSNSLRKKLKKYDGIAWYMTEITIPKNWRNREIFLYFGAVDESCLVYINGKRAGEHLFKNPNDWTTPFNIRIDPYVNWNTPKQRVTVRVEDKAGAGGIWKPVWLVSKK